MKIRDCTKLINPVNNQSFLKKPPKFGSVYQKSSYLFKSGKKSQIFNNENSNSNNINNGVSKSPPS